MKDKILINNLIELKEKEKENEIEKYLNQK